MTDKIMLAFFALMFAGLGVMLLVVGTRELIIQRRIMAAAVPVEALILSAEVTADKTHDTDQRLLRDNSTTSYTPLVRFAYSMNGTRYESELLFPTTIQRGYPTRDAAAEEIRQYTAGETVKAYADASSPERGFLRLEASANPRWFILAGSLTLAFLAVLIRFL